MKGEERRGEESPGRRPRRKWLLTKVAERLTEMEPCLALDAPPGAD